MCRSQEQQKNVLIRTRELVYLIGPHYTGSYTNILLVDNIYRLNSTIDSLIPFVLRVL